MHQGGKRTGAESVHGLPAPQAICQRPEAMREPGPRERTSWQPSSVTVLLKTAERLGVRGWAK